MLYAIKYRPAQAALVALMLAMTTPAVSAAVTAAPNVACNSSSVMGQ